MRFADDLVIFYNGDIRNLQRFRRFLDTYQRALRQLVNLHKIQAVVGAVISGSQVSHTLGMNLLMLPIKYFGSYLYKGINRATYCTSLIDHFDAMLNSWSLKLLSMAGRVTLLRHVLCTMPIHIIASSRLPKSLVNVRSRKMSNFLWNGHHHWQSWDSICRSKEFGGLDIRNLSLLQQAYDCGLWWAYTDSSSLWAHFCHLNYGRRTRMWAHIYDSRLGSVFAGLIRL